MGIELTIKMKNATYSDIQIGDILVFGNGARMTVTRLRDNDDPEFPGGGDVYCNSGSFTVEEDLSDATHFGIIDHIVRDIELSELKQLLNQP